MKSMIKSFSRHEFRLYGVTDIRMFEIPNNMYDGGINKCGPRR